MQASNLYTASAQLNNQLTTHLTATVPVGGTVLPVENTTGITVGDKLFINDGSAPEVTTVSSIDATAKNVTVSAGLAAQQDYAAAVITVYDAASSSNLQYAFAFTNETFIPALKTVRFDFGFEPEEAGTQNNFVADGGSLTSSAKNSSSGLPSAGTPSLVVTSSTQLDYTYTTAQSLAADTAMTFVVDKFAQLPDGITTTSYPVKVSLIENSGTIIDQAVVWYSVEQGIFVQAQIDTHLTFAITGQTAPTNGSISRDKINYAELADGTAKTAVIRYTVSQNATSGYTVSVAGNSTLRNATSKDTIAAMAGSNTSPAAWPTVNASTTSAYGYHSSDAALGTGTTGRFSTADTFASFSNTYSEIAYSAGPTAGTTNDAGGLHDFTVKLEVDTLHPSGTYAGNFDLECVPNF